MHSQSESIFDFDGTLVSQNSTRVFEKISYAELAGLRKGVVYILYFFLSGFVINIAASLCSRLSKNSIDWRFKIFWILCKSKVILNIDEIISNVSSELSLNESISIDYSLPIKVATCGLNCVVQNFCEMNDINYEIIVSSRIDSNNGRTELKLISPSDKSISLAKLVWKNYLTDDSNEAELIQLELHKLSKKSSVTEDGVLFLVNRNFEI